MRTHWSLSLALMVTAAHADPLPIVTNECSTASFGVEAPSGIAYDPQTDLLTVIDPVVDAALFVTPRCVVRGGFSLSALGATDAAGIAFDTHDSKYAIVDGDQNQVFFADPNGTPLGSCDLTGTGIVSPTGVAYDGPTDTFAIVSGSGSELVRIDDSIHDGSGCAFVDSTDVEQLGMDSASGVGPFSATGELAVTGTTNESRVYLLSFQLDVVESFRTIVPAGVLQTGITYNPSRDRVYVVDSRNAQLLELDIRGTSDLKCILEDIPVFWPQGITVNEAANQILVVDDGNAIESLFYLNADNCEVEALVSLVEQGITAPRGVAYMESTDQLVVADVGLDTLFFLDYASGTVQSSCDLTEVGLQAPEAAAVIDILEWIVVTDTIGNAVAVLDGNCRTIEQNSVFGRSRPDAVLLEPTTGRLLVGDSSSDFLVATTFEGAEELNFPTSPLGLSGISGLTRTSDANYLALDVFPQAIYEWSVPLLQEPERVSGTFVGGVFSAVLLEGSNGNIRGGLRLPAVTVPVFGQYDPLTRRIDFGFTLRSGGAVVLTGTVSEDLETLQLPPPIGQLSRQR